MSINATQPSQTAVQLEVMRQAIRSSSENVVYLVKATIKQDQQPVQQTPSAQNGSLVDTYV